MINKTIWVLEHLLFGAFVLFVTLLPVIVSQIYKAWALGGRSALHPEEYKKIENREFLIFVVGYLLLVITFLYTAAPN